jgi:hypothetical protein
MKLKLLIIVFFCLHIFSVKSTELDSIYKVLYNFLENRCPESKYLLELNKNETFRNKIYLKEVLDTTFHLEVNIDLKRDLVIYKFYVLGVEDSPDFVLIKFFSDFYIYNFTDINRITIKLLELKEKYPNLLSDELFVAYMNELVIHYRFGKFAKHLGHNIYYYFDTDKWKNFLE